MEDKTCGSSWISVKAFANIMWDGILYATAIPVGYKTQPHNAFALPSNPGCHAKPYKFIENSPTHLTRINQNWGIEELKI